MREGARAVRETRTTFLLITSELLLLDEQPAPRFLGFRPVYRTVSKVKVGTIPELVLSNTRRREVPPKIATFPMARISF